ncbi:hypothetical protein OAS67_00625 [Alphaproteobacteria bacterium]|nr:hypothetical protein [Alphaproteobacteria bacterium]
MARIIETANCGTSSYKTPKCPRQVGLSKEIAKLEQEAAELQEKIDTLTDNGEAGIA